MTFTSQQNSVGQEASPDELGLLKDELEAQFERLISNAPEEKKEMILESIRDLKASDILHDAVKEGDIFPDFVLPDQNGDLLSSVDLRAKGPIVVIFFRGDWCPYCSIMLRMVQKYTPHFKARGATVVAIAPQTVEKAAHTVKSEGLNFSILSDDKSEYAQVLNIAFILDDKVQALYESFGLDAQEHNGTDKFILPIPATYVVETDGRVTYSFLETDYTKRAEPVDILNALPRIQSNRRRNLSEQLEMELEKLREKVPRTRLQSLFNEVDRLKNNGTEDNALRVGDKAPDFKLPDRNGQIVDSKKLRKNGPLVVMFNFGHKSPLCMTQLTAMQKYWSKFEAKGVSLVAISPSHSNDLYQAVAYSGAKYPLVSDLDNSPVMKQFGLQHTLPGDMFGAKGASIELPMAATYLIDRSGYIVYSYVNVDPTKRAEPLTVLKSVPAKNQPKLKPKRGPFSILFGGRLPRSGASAA